MTSAEVENRVPTVLSEEVVKFGVGCVRGSPICWPTSGFHSDCVVAAHSLASRFSIVAAPCTRIVAKQNVLDVVQNSQYGNDRQRNSGRAGEPQLNISSGAGGSGDRLRGSHRITIRLRHGPGVVGKEEHLLRS